VWNPLGVPLNRNDDSGSFWSYFVPGLLVGIILSAVIVCFIDNGKGWWFTGISGFFALGSGLWKDTFWNVVWCLFRLVIEIWFNC